LLKVALNTITLTLSDNLLEDVRKIIKW
jgi:hypothetical protein